MFVFPYDDYASGDDQLLIFACERVLVTAPADDELIAANNFAIGDTLYWNTVDSMLTKTADGADTIPVGRVRVANNLSGGVSEGDGLEFELDPDVRLSAYPVGSNGTVSKVTCGLGVFDGANPTPIPHGLTTCVSFVAQLVGTAAPGDNTSVLTANINGANVDVYAWKNTAGNDPTLVASTGSETFYWIAAGA